MSNSECGTMDVEIYLRILLDHELRDVDLLNGIPSYTGSARASCVSRTDPTPHSVGRNREIWALRLAVHIYGPEEPTHLAFAKAGDVDVPRHSAIEVESRDIIGVSQSDKERKVYAVMMLRLLATCRVLRITAASGWYSPMCPS